ncbi:carbon-nitrogen hydrolase family protein [Patulibacter sp. S7RM1-6]
MSRHVSIAAVNFAVRPVSSFDEFTDHVRTLLRAAEGADVVVFPELFTVELFSTYADWQRAPISELTRITEFTDAYRAFFAEQAKERDQTILAGSHLVEVDGRYVNVGHLYEPDGTLHTHTKTHIFPAEADWSTEEGDEMNVIELPFAKVAMNICYEAEIPECAASATEQGAEIVLCPSYTFTEAGFWRVRHCAASRAIENQIYVVHACTGGRPGAPLPNGWAQSSILSPCDAPWTPNGVVAQATVNEEMVVRGSVDLDALHRNRENGVAPTFRDRRRRADTYAGWPSHLTAAAR